MSDNGAITVEREVEGDNHWTFDVSVVQNGTRYGYKVTLSWADYDLWSHGRVAPQHVVEAAFGFLLEREPADMILSRFDCSVIRRYFPEVDKLLPRKL
jgi:hypothetical protein